MARGVEGEVEELDVDVEVEADAIEFLRETSRG